MVELLVYMGILSILIFVITEIFVSVLGIQLESEATSSVEQDSRYLLAKLGRDIYRAEAITLPAANGQTASTLGLIIDGTTYTYTLDGTNLIITVGATSYQLNGYNSKISNLDFARLGNPGGKEDTITASFTTTSRVEQQKGSESASFKTTFARRRNN